MTALQRNEMQWIMRVRAGDTSAFEQIVDAYKGPVFNLCKRMLGESQSAEEASQETFLKAYTHMKNYDPERRFSNWILSIASHQCIDSLRKRRHRMISIDDVLDWFTPGTEEAAVEAHIIQQEAKEFLQELIEYLNPVDRAVIVLFYWYDFSQIEIAEILSTTPSAVKSRLHRSRRRLAKRIVTTRRLTDINQELSIDPDRFAEANGLIA